MDYIGLFIDSYTENVGNYRNEILKDNKQIIVDEENILIALKKETTFTKRNIYDNEKLTVIFSGTCFNEQELNEKYKGESLAESLAIAFQNKNIEPFKGVRGKFSIIIFDKDQGKLYAIRDQFGVNELFFTKRENVIIFSTTKKLLTNYMEENVNLTALQHYLSFQYVPNPLTLTESIELLSPGHYAVFDEKLEIETKRYFDPTFQPIISEKRTLINMIRDALFESVETQMGNDLSIGSFLSGGIDSTFIASIAKQYKQDLKTFSVGFEREGFSEIDIAKETADKLDVENISKVISPEEYVDKLPEIMWHLDDPLADPACVPLYFVANEAKKHVDYALSGEGADELFGGYNIYREPESLKMFQYMPMFMKGIVRSIAQKLPEHMTGKSFLERGTTPLNERYIGNAKMFEENEKRSLLMKYNPEISYTSITKPLFERVKNEPLTTQMQYIDIGTWLPGDILLKARKMTKANNLEVRMPFLDINVFEVARKLSVDVTIADGTTKKVLREAARGIIPDHVLDRKKLGFPVPTRHWLKNELNSWARQLINDSETDEYINKAYVHDLLQAHCKSNIDYSRKIWTLLMFMLWHQVFVEKKYDFS